jgi:hypothetical protein
MARSIFHQVGATELAHPELTTLVNFNGTNGQEPAAGLIADGHGDLFVTTGFGGVYSDGTVFEIAKTDHGYASTPTTLFSFSGVAGNGPNGGYPISGLIADAHGDLFGTTSQGGANGDYGTVFEITGSGFSTHKTPSCSVVESHDSFVFAANLGENTNVHSNVHDETIDHPKSEFAQLTELTQSHRDAANLTHDAIDPMDHAAALTAQHAHHFLV